MFVYHRDSSGWSLVQSIDPPVIEDNLYFGESVDISGDRFIVGSVYANDGKGAAHIYALSSGSWVLEDTVTASDADTQDTSVADGPYFGRSVAISGDYAVVGAERADYNTQDDSQNNIGRNNFV